MRYSLIVGNIGQIEESNNWQYLAGVGRKLHKNPHSRGFQEPVIVMENITGEPVWELKPDNTAVQEEV